MDAAGRAVAAPKRGALDAPLTPDALVRPWRTATLVAALFAAVELVVLIVLAGALLAKPIARAVKHQAEAAALAPVAPAKTVVRRRALTLSIPRRSRKQLGVVVLNGNGRSGAAGAAASTLGSLGYHIRATANARRQNYATTVVMYRRGYAAEGARLARDLHVSVVGPLDGMGVAALHGGQLIVILGAR